MAFVIVQHLDPHHESSLTTILATYTSMPVQLAEDGAAITSERVYVIPPDVILTVKDGRFSLTRPAPPAARRMSINTFLMSLAEDQGENAVGIILSGFGSDGALGIAAIKEYNGLTLSQAEFDHHAKRGMPQSAASGGFVDHVLAVEEMPAALARYRQHLAIEGAARGADGIRQDLPGNLTTICAVLHGKLGRDFSQYKRGTLMRRIQRRMHVLQTEDVEAYIGELRASPNEAELLFHELLIGVTQFFRDRAAFELLEAKVMPELIADPRGADAIRVWVAGCATGEEAYSVAILLREALARSAERRPVQIFGTDVDGRAIAAARAGLYSGSIVSDMSPERLERHFVKEDGAYRVAKELREMCLFSVHDLVKDPPFSRLDFISCRNLMIYFEPQLQQRVFATFHYGLRTGRHLFLGPSEGIGAQSHLFAPADKRHRLYVRQDAPATFPNLLFSPAKVEPAERRTVPASDDIDRRAARAIAPYAPAFVVVDRQHEILRFSGQTAKFLAPATGIASLNLFSLLHPDLRAPVRTALGEAAATGEKVLHGTVRLDTDDQGEMFNLIVEPLRRPGEDGLQVVAFSRPSRRWRSGRRSRSGSARTTTAPSSSRG